MNFKADFEKVRVKRAAAKNPALSEKNTDTK